MTVDDKIEILVVDDSRDTRELLARMLGGQGYLVKTCPSVKEALDALENAAPNLVITDVRMPENDGFDLLRHVRDNFRDVGVLMITGFPALPDAVQAIKIGAEEYLVKPFTESELLTAVRQAMEKQLAKSKMEAGETPSRKYGLIGRSKPMRLVFRDIERAASILATLLIQGESGTGKELIARAVHYNSSRANAAFVPVNCGSIPEQLLESELFGFLKGSFTGATTTRAGFFQTAHGGTVFLDEIAEASPAMQVKLLRVLQDKEVCMVGSNRPQKIDVRIMAATNKNLHAFVEKGLFREDLYYRLNVVTINAPPLRDRGDDLYLLITHFLDKFAREFGREKPEITDEALSMLATYSWPGNVRELENTIQRLVAMSEDGRIDRPDLPTLMRSSISRKEDLTRTLAEVERQYIGKVLESVEGNKTIAAKILGIDRKTLRQKLDRSTD